jgi:hypothetical protein
MNDELERIQKESGHAGEGQRKTIKSLRIAVLWSSI